MPPGVWNPISNAAARRALDKKLTFLLVATGHQRLQAADKGILCMQIQAYTEKLTKTWLQSVFYLGKSEKISASGEMFLS